MGVNNPKQHRCPPERADHLKATRFKPGQSGNPGGRPPTGRGLSRKLREMTGLPAPASWRTRMASLFPDRAQAFDDATMEDVIAWSVVQKAAGGGHAYIQTLLDRLEGRAPVEVSVRQEAPTPEAMTDRELLEALERLAGSGLIAAGGGA
jgi:hypothetical protein